MRRPWPCFGYMANEFLTYEQTPFNQAIGRGTIYKILGVAVAAGLVLTLILGMSGTVGPGLFTDGTAFAMGGVALVILGAAMLVLLFSLTATIRHINREMEDLTRLRNAIEISYSRLAGATQSLGREVADLREVMPTMRRLVAEAEKTPTRKSKK